MVSTSAGLPQSGWIEGLLGEKRVRYVETGRPLMFAREPRHVAVRSHTFDLYYDAGSWEKPKLEMPVVSSAAGEEYLRLPTDGGAALSTLLALHAAAYAAGMLVRYHPGYYAAVVGRTEGAPIAPLLSAAVAVVEKRYPALVLDALGG